MIRMRLFGLFNFFSNLVRTVTLALVVIALVGCTVLNKVTFEILPSDTAKRDSVLQGIENYFKEIGVPLERKTDHYFPEKRKITTYFVGNYKNPALLYSSYSYMTLRLEASNTLYIDWVKISDLHEKPRPDAFDNIHKKIAEDLMARVGVSVKFNHVQEK